MTEILQKLLGQYAMNFLINVKEFSTLFVYAFVLTLHKNKRKGYAPRLSLCLIAAIVLCLPLAVAAYEFNTPAMKIVIGTLINVSLFGVLFFCYKESFAEICFCWTGIIASKGFVGNLFALTLNAFGKNDLTTNSFFETKNRALDWTVNWLFDLVFLALIYFLLRRQKSLKNDRTNNRNSVMLASITYILACPLYAVMHMSLAADFMLAVYCKLLFVIIYFLILIIRAGLFFQGEISSELEITEQLLYREKKHYENMKENIDAINIKCHDLKRQLSSFQNKLTEEEFKTMRKAVEIYDSNVNTGSEILDVMIYQKQLWCEKNGIRISCIADASGLCRLSNSDLYALFANALENAIDAVRQLSDPEKRSISMNIARNRENTVIEIANYFDAADGFDCKKPLTSKKDKTHHGYGIKSMKYIADKYNGNLRFETQGDMFFLTIALPTAADKRKKS